MCLGTFPSAGGTIWDNWRTSRSCWGSRSLEEDLEVVLPVCFLLPAPHQAFPGCCHVFSAMIDSLTQELKAKWTLSPLSCFGQAFFFVTEPRLTLWGLRPSSFSPSFGAWGRECFGEGDVLLVSDHLLWQHTRIQWTLLNIPVLIFRASSQSYLAAWNHPIWHGLAYGVPSKGYRHIGLFAWFGRGKRQSFWIMRYFGRKAGWTGCFGQPKHDSQVYSLLLIAEQLLWVRRMFYDVRDNSESPSRKKVLFSWGGWAYALLSNASNLSSIAVFARGSASLRTQCLLWSRLFPKLIICHYLIVPVKVKPTSEEQSLGKIKPSEITSHIACPLIQAIIIIMSLCILYMCNRVWWWLGVYVYALEVRCLT